MHINRLSVCVGVAYLALTLAALTGCGGANGDDVQVADTRADGSKMTSDDKAAAEFVRGKVEEHWGKGPDGWTTQFQQHNVFGQVMEGTPTVLYKQYRRLSFSVAPETLTETMKLNGSDYRGVAVFTDSPHRYFQTEATYEGPQGWGNWKEGDMAFKRLAIERRNGNWLISDDDLFNGIKPTAAVPAGK